MNIVIETVSDEIFYLDFSSIITPDDCWHFTADGKFIPEERESFVRYHTELGWSVNLEDIEGYEARAAIEIAEIIRLRAETEAKRQADRNRTDAEKAADEIAQQETEAGEYHVMMKDLQAWDNDSDETRPSLNWRELEKYGL
jgi:hypothetical protein